MTKKTVYLILIFLSFSNLIEGQVLKIMTYNIRYDNAGDGDNKWDLRKEFLTDQIDFFQPDVFGIQEGLYHQVMYIDCIFSGFNFVGIGRDDGKQKGEYSAIFFNSKRLNVLEQATFWLSESPHKISVGWDASMERICTYALFEDKKTKQQFWVFNTHFDHIGKIARVKSAKLIVEKIELLNQGKLPVIVMGDLNSKPTGEPIHYLSKKLSDSKKSSLSKPFGPNGTFNGFKFHEPVQERIDYIFTDKEKIKVNKYGVLSDSKNCRYPSDHLPIYIEVEFKK